MLTVLLVTKTFEPYLSLRSVDYLNSLTLLNIKALGHNRYQVRQFQPLIQLRVRIPETANFLGFQRACAT
jgi:hypothetical protein